MFHAMGINVPIMTMILNKERWMGLKMRVKMRMTIDQQGGGLGPPSNWQGRTNRRPAYTLAALSNTHFNTHFSIHFDAH